MSRLVAVTGACGFLGERCVAALEAAGLGVRRLTRVPRGPGDVAFRLGEALDPAALRGVDAVIHAAHDFGVLGWEEMTRVNVAGTEAVLRAAREAGVRRIVGISSVSAFPGCPTIYGQAKLLLEAAVAAAGGVSVRPGLLYGSGSRGMFGTLMRLCRLPVLPLIDGGRQTLVLAHVDDAARAVVAALDWDPAAAGGPVILAHPEGVPLVEILRAVARGLGRDPVFFPVPSAPILAALGALERAGVRVRLRRDSLVSLLNGNPAFDFGGIGRLGLNFRRFLDQDPGSF